VGLGRVPGCWIMGWLFRAEFLAVFFEEFRTSNALSELDVSNKADYQLDQTSDGRSDADRPIPLAVGGGVWVFCIYQFIVTVLFFSLAANIIINFTVKVSVVVV
jgi:hypothetical protein